MRGQIVTHTFSPGKWISARLRSLRASNHAPTDIRASTTCRRGGSSIPFPAPPMKPLSVPDRPFPPPSAFSPSPKLDIPRASGTLDQSPMGKTSSGEVLQGTLPPDRAPDPLSGRITVAIARNLRSLPRRFAARKSRYIRPHKMELEAGIESEWGFGKQAQAVLSAYPQQAETTEVQTERWKTHAGGDGAI